MQRLVILSMILLAPSVALAFDRHQPADELPRVFGDRDPSDPGILRIERYTLTSRWEEQLGTRIRQRSAAPQIEMLDLSNDPLPTKAKPAS